MKVALRTVSADIVAKLVFPEWFLRYNPIKRLRNVSKAFVEFEVRSALTGNHSCD